MIRVLFYIATASYLLIAAVASFDAFADDLNGSVPSLAETLTLLDE